MAEGQERTERATPRRRQKAREKGQFARSKELTSVAGMAGMMLVLY
ncbi:MAG: EscU/YscU/HrcU family type III secretion system export apparatus switch protein, partial [Nitrospirae bacterium]|nr:EscU/YscU/HrcU family type III secretion system export apparatus switch protein [Nitrospirota bacterium]